VRKKIGKDNWEVLQVGEKGAWLQRGDCGPENLIESGKEVKTAHELADCMF